MTAKIYEVPALKGMVNTPVAKGSLLRVKEEMFCFVEDINVTCLKMFSGKKNPVRTINMLKETYKLFPIHAMLSRNEFAGRVMNNRTIHGITVVVHESDFFVILSQLTYGWKHSLVRIDDDAFWTKFLADEVTAGKIIQVEVN